MVAASREILMSTPNRYGALVSFHEDGVVLVEQTLRRGDRYVIDATPVGGQRDGRVRPGDEAEPDRIVRLAAKASSNGSEHE